ncbi:MAG TPA: adenylate/guanylate cyclase domain-containing protein, partial [Afifellaceae bacterium]|nr:adenylate/guanylate cyclase domain-containing protein [Afifellaceae bacterium]
MERRLAAILAADVVGYSRLMHQDEAGTLDRLKALRNDLVQPMIRGHEGRVFKLMGDGLLAEFPSAVKAVECGVEIQKALAKREHDKPEEGRIKLRIGVNLGDIIVEGSDVYGDGVNIASRLQEICNPDSVCISDATLQQVRGRILPKFEDGGEVALKNISEPVRVWRWLPHDDPA